MLLQTNDVQSFISGGSQWIGYARFILCHIYGVKIDVSS